MKRVSIFIGGGQDYYGETSDRDKKVVELLGDQLYSALKLLGFDAQLITGGTAGIPDDFARHFAGNVVDIVSEDYLATYLERTKDHPRAYWVAGKSQADRRHLLASNIHISVALFIQGGQFSTHEIQLFSEKGTPIVTFTGSGGASGGKIPYNDWKYQRPTKMRKRIYDSEDPNESVEEIVKALLRDIHSNISNPQL